MPPPPSIPTPPSLLASLSATKVEYVQLGTSGLRISSPILGTMAIGAKTWAEWCMDEEEGLELLKAGWDRGLTTWDTANVYSSGRNEEIVGKAIRKFEIPRHKLTVLAKCFGTVPEETGIFNWMHEGEMKRSREYVNQGGLSRTALFHAVDASLKRLGTDYIDLLQIHRFDPTVPATETMRTLHDLVLSGKVRYIGASSMWAYQFATLQFTAEKHGWTKFISMQNSYNLLYREEEREMNKFCAETGVGLNPVGPVDGGPAGEEGGWGEDCGTGGRGRGEEGVEDESGCVGVGQGQGAVPIVGLTSCDVQRLEEACAVREMRLTEEEMRLLEEHKPALRIVLLGSRERSQQKNMGPEERENPWLQETSDPNLIPRSGVGEHCEVKDIGG
ncbi:hypothetical protein G7Y79_00056g090180 [Physcia stellaris]|nr:hypothetical protein G7Y79_00056g090180 [Physcia stellaris]